MKTHILLISGLLLTALGACTKDKPEDVDLSVTADKTQVRVGDPVTFTIHHNVNALAIYTGDEGHDYQKSADNILKNKSSQELQSKIYRNYDANIIPYRLNFDKSEVGAKTPFEGGAFEVSSNLASSEVVTDASTGKKVLKLVSAHPEWWSETLIFNVNTKVGNNKTLTLRMKFETDIQKDFTNNTPHPEDKNLRIVTKVAGIAEGETQVTFRDVTVWGRELPNISTSYADYKVNIGEIIEAWENSMGKKMEKLSNIRIIFPAKDGSNIAYIGNIYLESASFASIDYFPFDTGKGITITDNSGVTKYTHTYDKAGTYEVVVVGSSSGFKSYSKDGYKTDVGTVSADEYKYNTEYRTIKITVTP